MTEPSEAPDPQSPQVPGEAEVGVPDGAGEMEYFRCPSCKTVNWHRSNHPADDHPTRCLECATPTPVEPDEAALGEVEQARLSDEQVDTLVAFADRWDEGRPYAVDELVGTIETIIEAHVSAAVTKARAEALREAADVLETEALGFQGTWGSTPHDQGKVEGIKQTQDWLRALAAKESDR